MFASIHTKFQERSSSQVAAFSLFLVAGIATLDHTTGYEMSFSIFYLMPIALAAWYGGRPQGLLLCAISAAAWFVVDRTAGHQYSRPFIPFWNTGVRFVFFVVTAELLAIVKEQLEKERVMARFDGLTGVLNGRAFREAAQAVLQMAARYGRSSVIGYIDIDNFKSVNDTLGHAEGDHVIRTVGSILLKSVRNTDLVGRLGGDEFAVLLPETSSSGAATMFEKLREELMREAGKHGWPIGFSVGVAVFTVPPASISEAIKLADALMYRVKNGGKNNIFYEEYGLAEIVQPPAAESSPKPRGVASDVSHL